MRRNRDRTIIPGGFFLMANAALLTKAHVLGRALFRGTFMTEIKRIGVLGLLHLPGGFLPRFHYGLYALVVFLLQINCGLRFQRNALSLADFLFRRESRLRRRRTERVFTRTLCHGQEPCGRENKAKRDALHEKHNLNRGELLQCGR